MGNMAELRKIEDQNRLWKYREYVTEKMNELRKGKLRERAR
jgi:hypothetical protein